MGRTRPGGARHDEVRTDKARVRPAWGRVMPNRILHESICCSESLAALDDGAQMFFMRLTVQADDFGRFDGRVPVLRSRCYQLGERTEAQVAKWLAAILTAELVQLYKVNERPYLQIVNWTRRQRTRAGASKYPDPPPFISKRGQPRADDRESQTSADIGGSRTRASVNENVNENVNEIRERERVHTRSLTLARPRKAMVVVLRDPIAFEEFWSRYPRKTKKLEAQKAWAQTEGARPAHEVLAAALAWQRRRPEWLRDGGQYIPHPATWLRAHQWDDEPPPTQAAFTTANTAGNAAALEAFIAAEERRT